MPDNLHSCENAPQRDPVDLVFGATTPVGLSLIDGLTGLGKTVIASGRATTPPHTLPPNTRWVSFDFLSSGPTPLSDDAPWRSHVVDTAYFLSHPTFRRDDTDPLSLLPAIESYGSLYRTIAPCLRQGSILLFLLPDPDRMPTKGYLSSRIYLDTIRELILRIKKEQAPRHIGVAAVVLAHIPGHKTPHMNPKTVERVARTTLGGRLVGVGETVRLLMELSGPRPPGTFPTELFIYPDGPAIPDS